MTLELASRVLGVEVQSVDSSEIAPSVSADCDGHTALVVPPSGRVRMDVGRGFTTLTGYFAVCGEPTAGGMFIIRTREHTDPPLLFYDVGPDNDPGETDTPFTVTFWSEAETRLVLATEGDPQLATAWRALRIFSRPSLPPRSAASSKAAP